MRQPHSPGPSGRTRPLRFGAAQRCWAWSASLALACEPTQGFESPPPGGLCGTIATSPAVRDGFPAQLQLNLRLNLDTLGSLPGTLTSLEDPTVGPCAPRPLFDEAPLRASPALSADGLSGLEFGPARLLNILGSVQPSCGPAMLAVVSLMRDDSVELRLLRPRDNQPYGFGLFLFSRPGCLTAEGPATGSPTGLQRAGESR